MRLLLIPCLLLSFATMGQTIDLEKEDQDKMEFAGVFKSAIGIEGGGKSGFVGLYYDLLLSRRWRIGIGAGYPGVGVDLKCYPFGVKRSRFGFNIGVRSSAILLDKNADFILYTFPVGFSYFARNRFNIELDGGPTITQLIESDQFSSGLVDSTSPFWFSAKIGYRFSFYAIKRARELNSREEDL